jgi:hypothetical protein
MAQGSGACGQRRDLITRRGEIRRQTRSEPWAGATPTGTRGKAAGSAVTPPTATLTILRNRSATTDQTGGPTSLLA